MLGVSVSGYYCWRIRPPSTRSVRHAMLLEVIREIHHAFRRTYGARRVHAELVHGRGVAVARCTVELVMRRNNIAGLPGRTRYRKVPNQPTAGDLVDRRFWRDEPDQLWVTDITEHPTREGKVYCAVVLDVFSRRVVGWSIDSRPQASLATNALAMAIENREPHGSTIHSDHGTQFTSWAFTQRALDAGLAVSMGRSGTVSITPSSSRSGPACKSSCSTGGAGAPAWSCPTPSSSTLRSSTTGNGGTHRSACSRPSSTRSVTPPQPSEIKQADSAKHRAHHCLV